MSERNMRIVFSSGITSLTERNTSFDSGILRVCYTGKNRNNSFISKETFERCMPSIYNCPIVCRYDREEDIIGSHDMELVTSDDGSMRIVNVTQPVGVVPESAKYWWEEIEDGSGVHEYLCVNVLLWKRQEAYKKIKEDGITDESMEISVKEGRMVDGVYVIDRFEFTAFCLLGTAEPCYESASLEMFSCSDFKQQLADMMQEFVQAIDDSIKKGVRGIHTAMPGVILSYDAGKGLATVQPTMKFKKPDGDTVDYAQITGVPVVFQQGMNQEATVAFPVKPGDGCLIIIAEQSIDYWLYGQETETDLAFDLTNAICIPGLFTKANSVVKAACDQNAVIADVSGTRLTIKKDGLIQADCKKFVINASDSFKVNAGRIDLN